MKRKFTLSIFTILITLTCNIQLGFTQACIDHPDDGTKLDGTVAPYMGPTTCLPPTNDDAAANRGFMFGCSQSTAECPVTMTPTETATPIPEIADCSTSVTYQEIVNEPSFHMAYWNNCISGVSGIPSYDARSQGFINQLFCKTDGQGYPRANPGIPAEGTTSQFPNDADNMQLSIDEIAPGNTCDDSSELETELAQLDFWVVVPKSIKEIGFKISGGLADASLFMLGEDFTSLCAITEETQPRGGDDGKIGITEGYYKVPATATTLCSGEMVILRSRIYISDIGSRHNVTPQINVGNGEGFVDFVSSEYAIFLPTNSRADNVKPTDADIETETKQGLIDINGNIFDLDGNYIPKLCSYTAVNENNPCLEAENDINQTPQGVPVDGNVLTNDDNADGELTITSAMIDTNGDGIPDTALDLNSTETIDGVGTIKLNSDGTYTFTPCAGVGDPDASCTEPFTGSAPTIAYTAEDESGSSVTATLDIDVLPEDDPTTNEPPLANDDTNSTDQGEEVGGNLLSNDSDPDTPQNDLKVTKITFPDGNGGTTTVQVPDNGNTGTQTIPGVGTIIVASDGTYTFAPCAGPGDPVAECTMAYIGETPPIGYTVDDPENGEDDATLVIDIAPDPNGDINNTYANDDSSVGSQGEGQSTNVLANDRDPEGDTQTLTGATVEGPTPGEQVPVSTNPLMPTKVYKNGVEVGTSYIDPATGMIYFNPKSNFVGTVPITYTKEDGNGASDTATYYPTVVKNEAYLPIQLGEFIAKPLNMDAQLSWTTLSESNNSHFVIEVSNTGLSNDFEPVGQVDTKAENGNSQSTLTYEYIDKFAINRGNQLYYRLKQIDVDGTEAFTEIRVVLFENIFLSNMIYPNPVKQGQDVVIQGSNIKQYSVFNSNGRLVNEVEYDNAIQATSFSTVNLSAGLYYVVINNNDVRKVIVQ